MGVSEPLIQASLLGEAVDHGPAAVFVADEDGRYVAVSHAACALLGYTRAELLELRVSDVADPKGKWEQMQRDGNLTGVSTLTRKDGSKVEFSFVAGATSVAGMLVYVSVGTAA
jgi:PAS domain S-box-containing protein